MECACGMWWWLWWAIGWYGWWWVVSDCLGVFSLAREATRQEQAPEGLKDTLWQQDASLNVAGKATKKVLDTTEAADAASIVAKAKTVRAKAMTLSSSINYACEFMVDKDGKGLTLRQCKSIAEQAYMIDFAGVVWPGPTAEAFS